MENSLLLAIFVLLAATVIFVPLAKTAGLGTILGYLAAGVLIGPYGLSLVSDTEIIRQVSEFGIVMMLFLIGLGLQPRELWRMRRRVAGLGVTQLVITTVLIGLGVYAAGLSWQSSLIVGLALAMSSTAIAMQSVHQRDIIKSDTGRASLAILLVQDVAVIPILAAIPILVAFDGSPSSMIGTQVTEAMGAIENPLDWLDALIIAGGFVASIAGGRFLVRPVMNFVARAGVREAFTALGLALVVGAGLITQYLGMSPAMGAFIGGVLLADSEYRHELESHIEPFKGLLLGLFFISVGMSIGFSVALAEPAAVAGLVLGLIAVKMVVLFGLATISGMHSADRLLLAILLSQAGEFAFVILGFAASAGGLTPHDHDLLTVAVALSMATTPLLLLACDAFIARVYNAGKRPPPPYNAVDQRHRVIVLGYGRFGQIVTRMLRAQGFEMTLIDDDPAQIETVRRFGVKVFYGDASRLDLLNAAGAAEAELIVIAVSGADHILAVAALLRRHFPHVKVAARAIDRAHAHELIAMGIEVFERETFLSAIGLGTQALVALGYPPEHAARLAAAFQEHDNRLLRESYEVRHDEAAYIGVVRRSMDTLGELMQADAAHVPGDAVPTGAALHIGKTAPARSD